MYRTLALLGTFVLSLVAIGFVLLISAGEMNGLRLYFGFVFIENTWSAASALTRSFPPVDSEISLLSSPRSRPQAASEIAIMTASSMASILLKEDLISFFSLFQHDSGSLPAAGATGIAV